MAPFWWHRAILKTQPQPQPLHHYHEVISVHYFMKFLNHPHPYPLHLYQLWLLLQPLDLHHLMVLLHLLDLLVLLLLHQHHHYLILLLHLHTMCDHHHLIQRHRSHHLEPDPRMSHLYIQSISYILLPLPHKHYPLLLLLHLNLLNQKATKYNSTSPCSLWCSTISMTSWSQDKSSSPSSRLLVGIL
jgi:hypothetical protein